MTGDPLSEAEHEGPALPRLRALGLPARLLATFFLLAAGAGFVAAEVNLWATHADADGKPGLGIEDIRRVFHGRPEWSLLASKIDGGSMEKHVPIPSQKKALLDWARAGAKREGFDDARKVLDTRCLRCHSPGGEKEESPFGTSSESGARYEMVRPYCEPDHGMPIAALARSSHAHLFGMGTLFLGLGALFLLTDTGRRTKAAVVALPFVAMLLDIGSWWLAKLDPIFCWTIVAGGALMGLAFAVLTLLPLWELWGPRKRGLRV